MQLLQQAASAKKPCILLHVSHRQEMKVAAAKDVLLTSALRALSHAPPAFAVLRYYHTKFASLEDAKLDVAYSTAGNLRAISEAMSLWAEVLRLRWLNTCDSQKARKRADRTEACLAPRLYGSLAPSRLFAPPAPCDSFLTALASPGRVGA